MLYEKQQAHFCNFWEPETPHLKSFFMNSRPLCLSLLHYIHILLVGFVHPVPSRVFVRPFLGFSLSPIMEKEAQPEPEDEGGIWFVLEKASLEVAKVGKVNEQKKKITFLSFFSAEIDMAFVLESFFFCFLAYPLMYCKLINPLLLFLFLLFQNYQLLNCDDHSNFLRKHKKDPALFRPDIVHQVWIKERIYQSMNS